MSVGRGESPSLPTIVAGLGVAIALMVWPLLIGGPYLLVGWLFGVPVATAGLLLAARRHRR